MGNGNTDWHAIDGEDALAALEVDRDGLTSEEASRRLDVHGRNAIESADAVSPLRILLHQFVSPLIYVLVVALFVTVAIEHYTDAVVIAAVLGINAVIGFVQEYRAENAMAALASLFSPKATTRRGGVIREVDSAELVPGDVVNLESGDVVPADVRLIETADFRIDNSILTGESLPLSRTSDPVAPEATVAERTSMAYMGTSVVSGRATGVVVETGLDTQIGRIAGEMRRTERAVTPLQRRMHRFGNAIAVAVLAAGLVVFLVGLGQGLDVSDVFLLAVAIAVSAIPEGLPVVMTVALAVSARRMADRNAIVRRLPAVETLGSCSVIVSDKTGTMTQNRMTVRSVWTDDGRVELASSGSSSDVAFEGSEGPVTPEAGTLLHETLLAGVLANEASFEVGDDGEADAIGDPTETALLVAGRRAGLDREALLTAHPQVGRLPFESERRYAASAHEFDDGTRTYLKGAPERVLELCDRRETEEGPAPLEETAVLERATELANEGLRVLAMARADGDATTLGESEATERGSDGSAECGGPSAMAFLGLVGMVDPPREGVREAVSACHRAGIRVLMVTGDHADTARAIAREVGIDAGSVLTGTAMAELSDAELTERLRETAVLARINPTQKLRIVTLLQADGETVAVTGDGVNDAPALKAAHIGAAMGISGTDVAKEASEMVLTDDNFATVYAAVEEGRTVFSNIRKATSFLLATGVGLVAAILAAFALAIVGVLPTATVGAFPLLLLPAQALWLNVVNNGIQDVALAFEPGEPEQFTRPPYDADAGLLSRALLERTVLVGVVLAVLAVGIFWWVLAEGATLAYAQTAALTTMVVSMAMFVGTCRSETRSIVAKSPFSNPLLLIGTIVALSVHVGAMHFGPTQFLLGIEPVGRRTWLHILVVAPVVIVVVELHKGFRRDGGFGREEA